ncbi:ABC transporter ATP-binding protein [Streptomyces sp. NPDC051453]|uniref:ABC transporter ATP-binding protein n=1 Tax=Streptomyces sp. NPDC051453 TaxID=3154941 RepID=UPI0034148222
MQERRDAYRHVSRTTIKYGQQSVQLKEIRSDGLRADRVRRETAGHLILDGVSVHPAPGGITGLIGPNGSGKTTLLLAGILTPQAGVVTLDGSPLSAFGRRDFARRVAVVEQQADTQFELRVEDVVRLGRIPHRRAWMPPSAQDEEAVRSALARTDLTDRAHRHWHTVPR